MWSHKVLCTLLNGYPPDNRRQKIVINESLVPGDFLQEYIWKGCVTILLLAPRSAQQTLKHKSDTTACAEDVDDGEFFARTAPSRAQSWMLADLTRKSGPLLRPF